MKCYNYEGIGNSFTLIEKNIYINDYSRLAIEICKKFKTDGLIIKELNKMYFYNKDGSHANFCGNAIRCLTMHIYAKFKNDEYIINCSDIDYKIEVVKTKPFTTRVKIDNVKNKDNLVEAGVFHEIIKVSDIKNFEEKKSKYNINYTEIIDRSNILVKTNELGVGFTKSCGSGSLACAYYLNKIGEINNDITIHFNEGILRVLINNNTCYLEGETKFISEGFYD